MSVDNRNFFELCNEILDELYYEEVETFDELEDITEGRRVKKLLNRALVYVCNNETENWKFKEVHEPLILVGGQTEYDKPNGYIRFIKRHCDNLVLNYVQDYKYLPIHSFGVPIMYWMDAEKIHFYPRPNGDADGIRLDVYSYTNNFAIDCNGISKLKMECECDVPIIPNNHRDVLIYKVCADWRANMGDAKSQYYEKKFREAYRAMKQDCVETEDYPSGLDIMHTNLSYKDTMLGILKNPYYGRRKCNG